MSNNEKTYWNGEPCKARIVRVIVGDHGRFERPWFLPYVGKVLDAVEVRYANSTFYIDNYLDQGWKKVTEGRGSPNWPHSSLDVDRVLED